MKRCAYTETCNASMGHAVVHTRRLSGPRLPFLRVSRLSEQYNDTKCAPR